MNKEVKGIESLLTMTPREISEYFAADQDHHLQYTENGEMIGITTRNDKEGYKQEDRLYYGIRDKGVLTRTIFIWEDDKWEVESKISG